MSRVPFWLVILFAVILLVIGGLAVLHRFGVLSVPASRSIADLQALPTGTGLIVSGIDRRNPGILTLQGRAAPHAQLVLSGSGKALITDTAAANGRFALPFRLPAPGKGWQMLQLQSGQLQPLPLLVTQSRGREKATAALAQAEDGSWQALTPPEALAIATVSENADGSWRLAGQHPSGGALMLQLYADGTLIDTQQAAAEAFILAIPKASLPQHELRVDAYDAISLQPVVRLLLPLPFDSQFEPVKADSRTLWIWKDAVSQQRDPAEALSGQIVPVAASLAPAKPN